ncbi:MAG: helix-turn-helix domain-containing protein [Nevskiales bacterium]
MRKITPSSGNVFKDLGFPEEEAANLALRADLMAALAKTLGKRDATQSQLATELGVTQARISDILRGNTARFSVDKLVNLLARVGQRVEVRVSRR